MTGPICSHCGGTTIDHRGDHLRCLDCHHRTGPAQLDLGTLLALRHHADYGATVHDVVARCCGHGAPPSVHAEYQHHLERLELLGKAVSTIDSLGTVWWYPRLNLDRLFADPSRHPLRLHPSFGDVPPGWNATGDAAGHTTRRRGVWS